MHKVVFSVESNSQDNIDNIFEHLNTLGLMIDGSIGDCGWKIETSEETEDRETTVTAEEIENDMRVEVEEIPQ